MDMNKEKIVYKKIEELHLNERNPRKNDEAVATVAKSIQKYGFRNPLIIDSNGKIYCGNTRYKAAKKLGLTECPCIVAYDLTEQQIREYALIDNKSTEQSAWDFDLLSEELVDLDLGEFGLDWGIDDDKKGKTKEEGEVPFTEELLLSHNYIVLYFDNDFDWEVAQDKFKLREVKDLIPRKSQPTGIGRVINGKDILKWKDN